MYAMKQPDWRWIEVNGSVASKKPPQDDFQLKVYNVIIGESLDPFMTHVLEIHEMPQFRDTMTAFFLSGATLDQIHIGLKVDMETLAAYEKLFFDRSAFRNRMEERFYAEMYLDSESFSDDGRQQIKCGLLYGVYSLLERWMGGDIIEIPAREVASKFIMTAFNKAQIAKNSSINSPEAREAFKWGVSSVRTTIEKDAMKDADNIETNALVAIQKRKATLTPQEAGIPLDQILH